MHSRFSIFIAVIICCSSSFAQEKPGKKEEETPRLFRGGLIKRFENLQDRLKKDREDRQKERAIAEKAKREAERKKAEAKKARKKKNDPVNRAPSDSAQPESSRRLSPKPEPQISPEIAPNTDFASQTSTQQKVSLGIEVDSGRIGAPGLIVEKINSKGPAALAGIQKSDRIISVGSSPIKKVEELQLILDALEPGDRTEIEYIRKNKKQKTIVEFPSGIAGKRNQSGFNPNSIGASNQLSLNPPSIQSSSTRGGEELPSPNSSGTNLPRGTKDTPLKDSLRVLENQTPLPQNGKPTGEFRAGLGLTALSVTPLLFAQQRLSVRQGAYVEEITKGSAADSAGLKTGSVLIAVDGRKVDSAVSLSEIIQMYQPGDTAQVLYYEGSRLKRAAVKLDAIPVTELTPVDQYGNVLPNVGRNFQTPNPQLPKNDPRNGPKTVFGGLADEFPRLKRIDEMIERFTPEQNSNQRGSSVEFNRNGQAKNPAVQNREAELENEVRTLRNRLQGQDQQIKGLTEKLNAIEKLLGRRKK